MRSMTRALAAALFIVGFIVGCGGQTSDPEPSDARAASDAPFEVSSACLNCINGCRPQLEACAADPSCQNLATCISSCDAGTSCVPNCRATNPSRTFDAYQDCISKCTSACAP